MSSVLNNRTSTVADTETWYGQAEDIRQYQSVNITCHTDQSGVLYCQFSENASDWDFSDSVNVSANTPVWKQFHVKGRYFRAGFLNNSGSAQTFMRLHSKFQTIPPNELDVQLNASNDSVAVQNVTGGTLSVGDSTAQASLANLEAVDFATDTVLSAMSAKLPSAVGQQASSASLSVVQDSTGDWSVRNTTLEGKIDTGNGHLSTIAGVDFATENTLAGMSAKIPANLTVTNNRLQVDASSATTSTAKNLDLGTTGWLPNNSACSLKSVDIMNRSAFERVVRVYDKGTSPSESDTPKLVYAVPANSVYHADYSSGVSMSSGLGLRASTGLADNDTGAPASNDVVVSVTYA